MKIRHGLFLSTATLFLSMMLMSCSGGSDGEESDTSDQTGNAADAQELRSDCGVVRNGDSPSPVVVNPTSTAAGEQVAIAAIVDSTHVIVQRAGGQQLIKLHGVRPPASGESLARSTLSQLATEPAILIEVGDSCAITHADGGVGIAGYLFTLSGKSYIEEIIKAGVALTIDSGDVCSAALVSPCYQALEETFKPKTLGQITDFLWKPKAESDYNKGSLVIHAAPCNATVVVNGETLLDFGPGNGRCNTSRAFKPGCAFGNNVKVEIFDNESGLPYTHEGQPFITVPRGCDRFEFKR